jgi:hypothetical protein
VLTAFFSSVSGKLADRFAALSAPALIFWLGGLLSWTYGHGGAHALSRPATWLSHRSAITQTLALLIVLAGIATSGLIIARLTTPVLRLLEGYWPTRPARLIRWRTGLIERAQRQASDDDAEWQQLMAAIEPPATPTAAQLARIGALSRAMHRRPDKPALFMPTRIGNILRAAESRPRSRYGLDSIVVWPRLWLVLPDSSRQEIAAARQSLDTSVAAGIWGVLFLVFIPWTILTLPTGLVVALVAWGLWVPARAEVYGDLVVAAFDIHRTALYQQLRWPLPASPRLEPAQGQLITAYLQVGSADPLPIFVPPR